MDFWVQPSVRYGHYFVTCTNTADKDQLIAFVAKAVTVKGIINYKGIAREGR